MEDQLRIANVSRGDFRWNTTKTCVDPEQREAIFEPDPKGRFYVVDEIGLTGGVDSYDHNWESE